MKRILQISNYMYPHIGGIEQTVKDISDVFFECEDIEQKIICFNEDAVDNNFICRRNETTVDKINDVEVIRCGCFTKIFSQSLSTTYKSELKCLLNNFHPNIIIFHYPNPFVASLLLPMLDENTKLVVWWHLDIVKQKVIKDFFYHQNVKLCERANIIVATSPNYIEGSKFLSKYKDKCVVIPSCIRKERFSKSLKTNEITEDLLNTFKDKTLCFAVGRHVSHKGFECLIDAATYLDDSYKIVIGGDGPLTKSLKEKSKNMNNVVLVGKLNDEELATYYQACSIFCFPSVSKNEAFGLTLAEAMLFGKPAVTFNISGSGVNYVSLNGITGIECPNKDSKAFAEAIKKISMNKELYDFYSLNAKSRVENYFMFDSFRKHVCDLISQL